MSTRKQKVIGRIHNLNTVEHVEDSNGTEIRIPPGGYRDMVYSEAVAFKGQFYHVLNAKKLRLEMIKPIDMAEALEEGLRYMCQKCSAKHEGEAELNAHIEAEHFDDLPEEVQKELKKKRGKKLA